MHTSPGNVAAAWLERPADFETFLASPKFKIEYVFLR